MTLGEHIQALRKDAGLSQEELGEKLGVARQSVSKWESDATVPELDKLMAMSKLFGISIGALLGMEESEGGDRELTDRELAALEAIAQRLTPAKEATPEERLRKKRRWPKAVAGLAIVVAGVFLVGRISSLENQLRNLQYNVYNMQNTVSREISSIGSQVRNILEEQNSVTAGKNSEIVDMDLRNNTVTFSLSATPREYREGMTAVFSATGPDFETVEVPGDLGGGQFFQAELTCPLTDDITLWVGFTTDGATVTQQLGRESYLFSDTQVDISGFLNWNVTSLHSPEPGKLTGVAACAWRGAAGWYRTRNGGKQEITVASGIMRLWKNDELIRSREYDDLRTSFGSEVDIPLEEVTLVPGDRILLSFFYTDNIGREREIFLDGFMMIEDETLSVLAPYEEGAYPWEKGGATHDIG